MDENENIWCAAVDIETTGLNANEEVPLEIGIKLIDKEGFVFAECAWLVYEDTSRYEKLIYAAKDHKIVGPMHDNSGLWRDLQIVAENGILEDYSRESVDEQICDWLTDKDVRFGTLPMFGNSTGSLDRPFTLVHFPKFNEALSYRNVDISSVKELCKANNPTLFENLKSIIGSKEDAPHRVLGDLDACITEYRAYRENFFFLEED